MEEMAGFYFCHCPDMQMAKEFIEGSYLSSYGDAWKNAVRRSFWLDDIGKYFELLDTIDFESKNRIFYLRASHELPLDTWKKLSSALGKPRPDTFSVFFVSNPLENGKLKLPQTVQKQKCFEFAQKKGWFFESPGVTDYNFAKIIKQEAQAKYGLDLNNETVNVLKDILSPDYNSINNILAQLSLFAAQGEITPQTVGQLANFTPELVLFDLIRKIEQADSKEVWKLLRKEGRQIEDGYLFAFIALMMREMRILWKIKAGEQVYLNDRQMQQKTAAAKRLGFTYISKIISLLCFAEYSVKSGKKGTQETFEELIKDILKIYKKDFTELSGLYTVNDEKQNV